MSTKIRFRSGNWLLADLKAQGKPSEELKNYGFSLEDIEKSEPAKPGDTWRINWYAAEGNGPLAGYAIACPKCGHVHSWTTANNCSTTIKPGTCAHSGTGSCWQWSGSAEEGTLTANPSLFASLGCGWHGFLRNGELVA